MGDQQHWTKLERREEWHVLSEIKKCCGVKRNQTKPFGCKRHSIITYHKTYLSCQSHLHICCCLLWEGCLLWEDMSITLTSIKVLFFSGTRLRNWPLNSIDAQISELGRMDIPRETVCLLKPFSFSESRPWALCMHVLTASKININAWICVYWVFQLSWNINKEVH